MCVEESTGNAVLQSRLGTLSDRLEYWLVTFPVKPTYTRRAQVGSLEFRKGGMRSFLFGSTGAGGGGGGGGGAGRESAVRIDRTQAARVKLMSR